MLISGAPSGPLPKLNRHNHPRPVARHVALQIPVSSSLDPIQHFIKNVLPVTGRLLGIRFAWSACNDLLESQGPRTGELQL